MWAQRGVCTAPTLYGPTGCSHFFICAEAATRHHSRPHSVAFRPTLSILVISSLFLRLCRARWCFRHFTYKTAFRAVVPTSLAPQGLVSWKTIVPRTRGRGCMGDGSGGNASDGERWWSSPLPLTSCCAAQFLTGSGPVPVCGPGVGDPCFRGLQLSLIVPLYLDILTPRPRT